MNEKFFQLPLQKQEAILNAGYEVFSQNSYKNSPMSEIASIAGISKSLLFYYFQNKKELYLYLWDHCARLTIERLTESGCYEQTDLFAAMEKGMHAKMEIICEYPHMAQFTIKAFYEKNPEISSAIQESYHRYFNFKADHARRNMNPEQFVDGLDLLMMYQEMYWASEGYIWELVQQQEQIDMEKMEQVFHQLIRFWKSVYLKKRGT